MIMMFDDDSTGNDDDDHHYCHRQGFDDTLRFLQKRYMISCTRCLAVASTYEIEDEMDEEEWEVIVMNHRDYRDGNSGDNDDADRCKVGDARSTTRTASSASCRGTSPARVLCQRIFGR